MASLRIETGRGLVEDHQLRLVDQRAGDGEPSLHAAGERLHLVGAPLGELDEGEKLVDALADHLAGEVEVAAVDVEVLLDVNSVSSVVLLGHDTEARPDRGALDRGIDPEHPQCPLGHRGDRSDHPHRRCLAGAVRAEEPEGLAGLDGELDTIDGGEVPEPLGQVMRFDQWWHSPVTLAARFPPPTGEYRRRRRRGRGEGCTHYGVKARGSITVGGSAASPYPLLRSGALPPAGRRGPAFPGGGGERFTRQLPLRWRGSASCWSGYRENRRAGRSPRQRCSRRLHPGRRRRSHAPRPLQPDRTGRGP